MIEFHSLEGPQLERFLERHKAGFSLRGEVELEVLLRQILQRANEFVPAESGSILLDDPVRKVPSREDNDLVFIAAFGDSATNLVGRRLTAKQGIVGRVYQTGTPYVSADVREDEFFYPQIDLQIGHKSHSIVAVPIYIGKTVCGVLELINRLKGGTFTARDMTLLEIFAGYTSFTLQNALDAKRAHELAKRDDLTGLFNDRWFNVRLTEVLAEARQTGSDCAVLFLDLDGFKVVNDCHGHLAGSQVLREVGFILTRSVQHIEAATVARYGGDEFVLILPQTPVEEAARVAEQIRAAVENAVFLEREWGFSMVPLNLRGLITVSIGLAQHVPDTTSSAAIESEKNDVLRRADAAMYEAKALGKNRVVVSRSGQQMMEGPPILSDRTRVARRE